MVGPTSINICLLTAFFVGMVFTLQVAKEFLALNAPNLIGSVLTIAFIRELSPVLTSVIIVGRVGSAFTAEIATMQVTEQIDALYLLQKDPISYLVVPRVIACTFMLPILNLMSIATSLASSMFICFTLYDLHPSIFLLPASASITCIDLIHSSIKSLLFGFTISNISCVWGLASKGSAKGVGESTTSSVVSSLLAIFILDFILSYLMFSTKGTIIQVN